MNQKTIQMRKVMIARSSVIATLLAFLFSCGTTKVKTEQNQKEIYEIIEKVAYGENSLYYKTLSHEELPNSDLFSYDKMNVKNVRFNSITEKGRFVNFDTIFNKEQRQEIDYYFKNLKSIELKSSQMTNPKILTKTRSPYGTPVAEQKGINSVTLPFIVDSINGDEFAFIFRSSSGMLHIYKKGGGDWEEFSRVEIQIL